MIIYSIEHTIKDITDTTRSASYLDPYLQIDSEGRLNTKIYDKRDDFNCSVVNFSFIRSNIPSVVNRISGVMASVLASSAVDLGFDPRSGLVKDYTIGICCFSAKEAALRRKSKDWLARNQDNVSEWGNMSVRGLLFQ